MLTKREQQTLDAILKTPPNNPVALHVLGQPLVDELCSIIRDQHEHIKNLRQEFKDIAEINKWKYTKY